MWIYWVIALVLLVAAAAITALTSHQSQGAQPTLFKDFKFPTPDEGTVQAVIFGDCWTNDWQVLWVGNYRTDQIQATGSGGGGKGGK